MSPDPATDPLPPVDETTLYVTTQGTQIGCRENQYVVRNVSKSSNKETDDTILRRLPSEQTEIINVFGRGVDVTSGALATAAAKGTPINYFTINGRFRGRFTPASSSVANLHRQQHSIADDTRLTIAVQIVVGKVANAVTYLRRKGIDLNDQSPLLTAPCRAEAATGMDELRGIEGDAARAFFELYSETLTQEWDFNGRSRRPPGDEVNSLLSLTYTFLERECESALRQVNLDPYVGVFHEMRHGRPALALDLIEEFRRAFADPFVARLLNRGTIDHDSFTTELKLCDDSFDRFVGKFDEYMNEQLSHDRVQRKLTRREVVRLQATLLRKRITGELDTYHPFRITR